MQNTASTGPFTLSTFRITQIMASIYGASTVLFNNDGTAYTTVDIK
jgi:hypothetical protein